MTGQDDLRVVGFVRRPGRVGIKKFKAGFEDYIAGRRKPVMVA